MLVVTVEEWPSGDPDRRTIVGVMRIANVTPLVMERADGTALYEATINGKRVAGRAITHRRKGGAWALVGRVLRRAGYL